MRGSPVVACFGSCGSVSSILPRPHVVVADASQVLPDFGALLALAMARHGDQMTRMASFITSPRGTGNFLRILVRGVLGPKELYLVLRG